MKKALQFFICLLWFAGAHGTFDFEASVGLRKDALKWSISGADRMPNVASELTWKDLESRFFTLEGTYFFKSWFCSGLASYGKLFNGHNSDSDFLADDKTFEFSRSQSQSNGENLDFFVKFGKKIVFSCKSIPVYPYLGWSFDQTRLKLFDGFQVINRINPEDIGPIKGLDSLYRTRFQGALIGAFTYLKCFSKVSFFLDACYLRGSYRGFGKFNLVEFLPEGFFHFAIYNGVKGRCKLIVERFIFPIWGLEIGASHFNTRGGVEKQRVVEDGIDEVISQHLNGVKYNNHWIFLFAAMKF